MCTLANRIIAKLGSTNRQQFPLFLSSFSLFISYQQCVQLTYSRFFVSDKNPIYLMIAFMYLCVHMYRIGLYGYV